MEESKFNKLTHDYSEHIKKSLGVPSSKLLVLEEWLFEYGTLVYYLSRAEVVDKVKQALEK